MLTLLEGRLTYWMPRLLFGVLLLIFGELVAWQNASHYRTQDWLALLIIYLATAALILDGIIRLRVSDGKSLLLMAGLFGLIQGTLISLAAVDMENLSIGLIFRPLGVEVLMFLLAFWCFQLLSRELATSLWMLLLAGVVGLGWGIWTRWFPELEGINQTSPVFGESMPYLMISLVLVGVLALILPPFRGMMQTQDWLLTPYEIAAAGGVLVITLILRNQYMDSMGLSIAGVLFIMLLFMLYFTRNARQGSLLDDITPPQTPNIAGWLLLLLPFLLTGWIGYNLPDQGDVPSQANILFGLITIWGVAWVPVVSIWLGISTLTQLTREGF